MTGCGPVFGHFPKESVNPGDLYRHNDCYGSRGAVSHSNDQVFLASVFHDGRCCAFVMGWAHFSDIGGLRPGSISPDALTLTVDIGGAFTDVTLQHPASGRAWRAFIEGVRLALDQAGAGASAIARVLHGTTVGTNLILEGKQAVTALITTAGFRHVLEIGRQDIPRAANLYAWRKPKRPVSPARVLEMVERVGPGSAPAAARSPGLPMARCRSARPAPAPIPAPPAAGWAAPTRR